MRLHCTTFSSLSLLLAGAVVAGSLLTGCSGLGDAAFPATNVGTTQQSSIGTIHGSVYGGHAPLVGSHVYLLQASVSGYNTLASSLLNSTGSNVTQNVNDPSIPTSWYYVTTDASGGFNVTGDYSCTAGLPVWFYAYGGTPTYSLTANNQFPLVSFSVFTDAAGNKAYQFTLDTSAGSSNPQENFFVGEQVTLSGYSGNQSSLNGSYSVIADNLGTTTFAVEAGNGGGNLKVGNSYTASGTVTAFPGFNSAAVNLAMLGVCPSSGSFATGGTLYNGSSFSPLSFVYMNEVSTAAMAYAMGGFGNDGLHVGTDTIFAATLTNPGIIGLENAAENAAVLYDIGGSHISTVYAGEGHIANPTVPGNSASVAPQALLDTVGNILAACVDSNNTYSPSTNTGTLSPQCSTLFSSASSTGGLSTNYSVNAGTGSTTGGGTAAANTAQAAFNIVHNPQTPAVLSLYTLPTGNVPFTPHLNAEPTDFTAAIQYTLSSPTSVAVDSYGDAYFAGGGATTSYITKFTPEGVVKATSPAISGLLDSIAIDQAGNVWGTTLGSVGGQSGTGRLYQLPATLASISGTYGGSINAPTALTIDSNSNIYIANYNSFPGGGGYIYYLSHTSYGTFNAVQNNNCYTAATSITFDPNAYLWTSQNANNTYCRTSTSGTAVFATNGNASNYNISLDSANNGWFGNHSQTNVYKVSSAGAATAVGKGSGNNQNDYLGGIYQPSWSAVDGVGNAFVQNDNGTNSSISEFSNTGLPLSCPTCLTQSNSVYGFQRGSVNALAKYNNTNINAGGMALDPSGNLWVVNYGGNTVLEIVGVGAPVVTPLSSLIYGKRP